MAYEQKEMIHETKMSYAVPVSAQNTEDPIATTIKQIYNLLDSGFSPPTQRDIFNEVRVMMVRNIEHKAGANEERQQQLKEEHEMLMGLHKALSNHH